MNYFVYLIVSIKSHFILKTGTCMKKKNTGESRSKPSQTTLQKIIDFIKLIINTLIIVFLIRTFIISTYQIPTGSMEDTLLIGDHIIANKFVFGVRSPDWIGIPYTRIGFHTPYFRIPGFRNPKSGDIVIFKYPEDTRDSYVKRCVALSGDTIQVRADSLYINGKRFSDAPGVHFQNTMKLGRVFPKYAGNRSDYGPVRVPAIGDTFHFSNANKRLWFERFMIMTNEGRRVEKGGRNDREIFRPYANWTDTELRDPKKRFWQDYWDRLIEYYPVQEFYVDGIRLDQYVHRVNQSHYFMMGDNRDNSLDSRYWGFVPQRYVLGEPVVIYWSWNKYKNIRSLFGMYKKVRWDRFLQMAY
jgi:signal peptidase I